MIKGIYEAHLPVSNLQQSIGFYEKLGLKLAWSDESTAFFWIEDGKSWLGLWAGSEYETKYHPSLRHIAFRVSYEDLKESLYWLPHFKLKLFRLGVMNLLNHLSVHIKVMHLFILLIQMVIA
ncbi:catechol 2,3-dioxygenase-like lactoylglutathione lyase family enzyme [Bacillus thuringiensis]